MLGCVAMLIDLAMTTEQKHICQECNGEFEFVQQVAYMGYSMARLKQAG